MPRGTKPPERISRIDQLKKDMKNEDFMPEMPPVNEAAYIIEYLFDMGPVAYGGMSTSVLTHSEVQAWQNNMGIELTPWEVQLIRRLSIDYLSESKRAEKQVEAPWGLAHKQIVSSDMRDYLRGLVKL